MRMDNRDYIAWLNNNWNLLDSIEFVFKRNWKELGEIEQKRIVKCLSEEKREIIEHILDELGV